MKRVAHEEQRGVPVRRGRAGRAREHERRGPSVFFFFVASFCFLGVADRGRLLDRIPPGRPHRGSRGLAFGPGRDPRAEVAPAGQVHVRRLRGADRGWVRVCHDVLDRGQRSPAQRPRIGARPVVRLVRRAARRHAQPPDQRHREDRVDEQAHVPPRGTVRALAPRLAFARTPAAHRSDESLRTTRRNGESIAATVDGKKTSRSRSGDGESSASRRTPSFVLLHGALHLDITPARPSTATLAWRFRSRPESEHLPRPPRRRVTTPRREKNGRRCE